VSLTDRFDHVEESGAGRHLGDWPTTKGQKGAVRG
jgi:hypothetical protein